MTKEELFVDASRVSYKPFIFSCHMLLLTEHLVKSFTPWRLLLMNHESDMGPANVLDQPDSGPTGSLKPTVTQPEARRLGHSLRLGVRVRVAGGPRPGPLPGDCSKPSRLSY